MRLHLSITSEGSQYISVTLNEELPCDTDCYKAVFLFKNELTNKELYFTNEDLSSWPGRINTFRVSLVYDPLNSDPDNGVIYLDESDIGTWTYTVYNQPCNGDKIEPETFLNILETGYLKITE